MAPNTADLDSRTSADVPDALAEPRSTRSDDGVPRSIGRVLDLLEIVLASRRCNLTAAAAAAGLTPTTALRHLRALEARGYVDRDGAGEFSAGPTILRIAASLHDGKPLDRLVATAQPLLDRLASATGESAYLAVADERTATYIATAESPRAIRHVGWVGQDVALSGSAVGAALAHPGTTMIRTGAVEPDITAISRALTGTGSLGVALSVVGPEHRFGANERRAHIELLDATVEQLQRDLTISGEDSTT